MNNQDWVTRGRQALSPIDEAQMLTEILRCSEEQLQDLSRLIEARECQSLLRRAALDQYARYKGPTAETFLERLTDFRHEPDEEIRLIAFQWLVELIAPTRLILRGPYRTGGWEEHLLNDPSPQVRWLAELVATRNRTDR
jgi:hypothetical protein